MTHAGVTLEVTFFGPMYDPRSEVGGHLGVVITFAIAFVLWVIGWIWLNRITHTEDYREANDRSWRSRDRLDLPALRRKRAQPAAQTSAVRDVSTMPRIRWPYRRELVLADVLFLAAGARVALWQADGRLIGMRPEWLAIVVIGYIVACMHAVAWLSHPWEPEDRFLFTSVAKRLADAALGMVLLIGFQFGQPRSSPMWVPPPSVIIGIPVGDLVFFAGAVMVAIGWIWIRLIARGNPEPEANDRFWWSRA
jgi:hypothetical protein